MAAQHIKVGTDLDSARGPPEGSSTDDGNAAERVQGLPCLSTHQGQAQFGCQPIIIFGERWEGGRSTLSHLTTRQQRTNSTLPARPTLTGSGGLHYLSAARHNTLLDNAFAASRRIIFDGRQQEGRNEVYGRTRRGWEGYCEHVGFSADPYLALLSVDKQELFLRAFLNFYRVTNWDTSGRLDGTCKVSVVASTL